MEKYSHVNDFYESMIKDKIQFWSTDLNLQGFSGSHSFSKKNY